MKAKLTKPYLDNLKPKEREFFVWDLAMPGFGVRVKPNGSRAFVVQHKTKDGRTRRRSLGMYGKPASPTLKQAYNEAKRILAMVELGRDPIGDARAKRDAITVAELCAEYLIEAEAGRILNRSKRPKATSTLNTDRGRINQHILPMLGNHRVEELTNKDISKFIRSIESGKTARNEPSGKLRGRTVVKGGAGTARRTAGLLSGILTFAVKQEYISANPAHGVERSADNRRTLGDVPAIYAALGRALRIAEDQGENWRPLALVRLVALTGMRRGEAVNLTWAQIRRTNGIVELERTKSGQSVRPFARAAIELLDDVPGAWGTGYVFPAPRTEGAAYGGLAGAWTRITTASKLSPEDRATLAPVTLHHLRHAAASTGNEIGFALPTIGAVLGHSVGGVTAGYIHHVDRALRAAADRLADSILAAMDERPRDAAVVQFLINQ